MIQLIFILVLLIPILAIVLDSPVGRALAGRLEQRGLSDGSDMSAERLAFLESEIERLTSEVSRLDEESQFLQQLLENRPATEALPPGDSDQ
jgi:uncharacterized small protein (DUF1192 family)